MLTTSLETITPMMAQAFLEVNPGNRPIRQSHVGYFEEQLRDGTFHLTHQGIAFDESLQLLDGQHRLLAIANTGITAQLFVTRGLPRATFAGIDGGRKRTAADNLDVNGAQNSRVLAAGIKIYTLFNELNNLVWVGQKAAHASTTAKIEKAYKQNPDAWALAASFGARHKDPLVNSSALSFLYFYAVTECAHDPLVLERFGEKLALGVDLSKDCPIYLYRRKRSAEREAKKAFCQQQIAADYIKLFNFFLAGTRLKQYKAQIYPPMPVILKNNHPGLPAHLMVRHQAAIHPLRSLRHEARGVIAS